MNDQTFFNVEKTKKGYIIKETYNHICGCETKTPNRTNIHIYNIRFGNKNGIIETIELSNFSLLDLENTDIREFSRIKKIVDIAYIKEISSMIEKHSEIEDIIDYIKEIITIYEKKRRYSKADRYFYGV